MTVRPAWLVGRGRWSRQAHIVGLVALLILVQALPGQGVTTAALTVSRGFYGPGIAADTLANTQLGGTDCGCANSRSSFRFRAVTTAGLEAIRFYVQSGSGYSSGTGGTIDISVQTDDGTSSHRPSGRVLASMILVPDNPVSLGPLPRISFPKPARLVAGRLYHLVFRNVDPVPSVNFTSINSLQTYQATSPRQPAMPDADWAQLLDTGKGWRIRPNFTPIAGLHYDDGVEDGVGYIEVSEGSPTMISGAWGVREVFSLRTPRSIDSVTVRTRRTRGTDPLEVRIETRVGRLVAIARIAASAVGSGWAWERATFDRPIVLPQGSSYRLVLTTPAGSEYSMVAIRKGVEYRFGSGTYFPYGYAQRTEGLGWLDVGDGRQRDLQFYFR